MAPSTERGLEPTNAIRKRNGALVDELSVEIQRRHVETAIKRNDLNWTANL